MDCGLAQLSVCADRKKRELRKTTTSTASDSSSENHFSFIKKYCACKIRCNYAGMNLLSAAWR